MINIRPNQILRLVDKDNEAFWFQIPSRGWLITFESTILVALLKIVKAKRVFEFGTYKGFTTRLFLENINSDEIIVTTLDLPSTSGISFQGRDEILALESLEAEREYLNSSKGDQVEQMLLDSMSFSGEGYEKAFDMIFIDANHKVEYARRDTENALKMVRDGGCIAWHDYGNPEFPELTKFLQELSLDEPIYHVEETMLCFYLPGVQIPSSIGIQPKN